MSRNDSTERVFGTEFGSGSKNLFADLEYSARSYGSSGDEMLKFAGLKAEEVTTRSAPASEQDRILESMKAIIFEVDESSVRLKLGSSFASFPKSVVSTLGDSLRYGQSVIYSIRIGSKGLRYQHFEIDDTPTENPYKQRVLDTLKKIK
jgi:hypothetical protein